MLAAAAKRPSGVLVAPGDLRCSSATRRWARRPYPVVACSAASRAATASLGGACRRGACGGAPRAGVLCLVGVHGHSIPHRLFGETKGELGPHARASVAVDAPAPAPQLDQMQAEAAAVLQIRGVAARSVRRGPDPRLRPQHIVPDLSAHAHDAIVGRECGGQRQLERVRSSSSSPFAAWSQREKRGACPGLRGALNGRERRHAARRLIRRAPACASAQRE